MISLIISLTLRLSDFCQAPNEYKSPVQIDEFDIPFESCSIKNFQNIEITTTYLSIQNYSYRTLRLDNQLKFTINEVISGDILTKLDIFDSIVTLNIHPSTPSSIIEGSLRINKINGSQLIINDGSFQMNSQKLIRIIHTNDVHCAYIDNPSTSTIGLAKFVSYVKKQKQFSKQNGYSVFSVDCGDFNQGLPLCNVNNGSVGHEALKLAKYDAFTLGNHEFDYGHHNIFAQWADFKKLNLPLIVSNIIDNSAEEKMEFTPYIIKEVNSFGSDDIKTMDGLKIKVGIFGLVTPYTNVTTNPLEVKDVNFESDIVSISKKYVQILREEEKCDVVVLISHLGYESLDLTSNKIAESFDGIDVIIDGHSHTTLPDGAVRLNNDYTTLIAQTGSSFQHIGVVDIMVDSLTKKVVGKRAKLLNYSDMIEMDINNDKEIENFLNEKEKEVEEITKVIIGKSKIDLDCTRSTIRKNGQSKMANLATTAFLYTATEADFCIANAGGIRNPILAGDITYGDAVSVLPFGNQIVVLNISGSQLHYLLRYGTRLYNQEEYGGFPVISGLSFTLNLNQEWTSENRITDLKIVGKNGEKSDLIIVDDSHFYKLATIDFLYYGGDGYESITEIPRLNQYSTELNSVIEFIKSRDDATITGDEDFFKYERINVVGSNNVKSASNFKGQKSAKSDIIYDDSVVITSGSLNMMHYRHTGVDGKFTPLYNFTIKANSIVAYDVWSIDSVLNENAKKFVFVGKDGTFVAANNSEIIVGDLVDFQIKELNDLYFYKKCSFFKRINKNGVCKVDVALVTTFTVMCALIIVVIILGLLLILKVKKGAAFNQSENPTANDKVVGLLNNYV